jgi:hypothetical protein
VLRFVTSLGAGLLSFLFAVLALGSRSSIGNRSLSPSCASPQNGHVIRVTALPSQSDSDNAERMMLTAHDLWTTCPHWSCFATQSIESGIEQWWHFSPEQLGSSGNASHKCSYRGTFFNDELSNVSNLSPGPISR